MDYKDLTEIEKEELKEIGFNQQEKIDQFFFNVKNKRGREEKEFWDRQSKFQELNLSPKSDYHFRNGKWEVVK